MNYGQFLRRLKPYLINKSTTNEDLVNGPLTEIVKAANIKKKKGSLKGEPLYYESTAASRIINNKLELPSEIREALKYDGMDKIITESFNDFYEDEVDKNLTGDLIDDFLTAIESDSSFKKKEVAEIKKYSNEPSLFLAKLFIKALKEPNLIENIDDSIVWSSGNSYIKVIKGDIFTYALGKKTKKRRIVVIPANTSFDVHVTTQLEAEPAPVVSSETLHGDLLNRIKKSNIDEDIIEKRIRENLKVNKLIKGNEKKLDLSIGTIAALDLGSATIYLLAVSRFDKKNKAHSSKEDIQISIQKLLEYYDDRGQGYDMYLPLIGTGRSRAGLDNQESLDLIIETMLTDKKLLNGKINIVIRPQVIDKLAIRKEK